MSRLTVILGAAGLGIGFSVQGWAITPFLEAGDSDVAELEAVQVAFAPSAIKTAAPEFYARKRRLLEHVGDLVTKCEQLTNDKARFAFLERGMLIAKEEQTKLHQGMIDTVLKIEDRQIAAEQWEAVAKNIVPPEEYLKRGLSKALGYGLALRIRAAKNVVESAIRRIDEALEYRRQQGDWGSYSPCLLTKDIQSKVKEYAEEVRQLVGIFIDAIEEGDIVGRFREKPPGASDRWEKVTSLQSQ